MGAADRETPLAGELAALPRAAAERRLADIVAREVSSALQLASPDAVLPDTPFTDLGFDSLRAVDFKDVLEDLLGRPLRTTLLFDQATPRDLVRHLVVDVLEIPPARGEAEPAGIRAPAATGEPVAVVGAGCRL
ncbi:MAG: acyl carrier protein, partial [Anaerolineae bacterium]